MGLRAGGARGGVRNLSTAGDTIPDPVLLPQENDLDNFTGDKDFFDIQNETHIGDGDFTLEGLREDDPSIIASDSGLNRYPEVGQVLSCKVMSVDGGQPNTFFGVQDIADPLSASYSIRLRATDDNNITIIKDEDEKVTESAPTSENEVYLLYWYWRETDPAIEVELYNVEDDPSTNSPIASLSYHDTEYTDGGVAFRAERNKSGSNMFSYWADYYVEELL